MPKKTVELDANGKPIEYVYYTPTGSNIPVRVRKDQLKTDPADTERSQQVLRQVQQVENRTPPSPN